MTHSLTLVNHRQQFPALHGKTYFNYGGQGPMATAAIAALTAAHHKLQTEGPFGSAINQWLETDLGTAVRKALGELLQMPDSTLTLTESVTAGCNIGLWGLDWQPGDRILITDCEHPGVIAAVQEVQRRFGVAVDVCPILATAQGGDPLGVIQSHCQPRTRLLVVSHILWNTGQVLPLEALVALCHGHTPQPIWVLVDGAQSVGMMPLALAASGVDFYAFTGHKWCCGAGGLGGLYVRPEIRDRVAPTFIGWRSITSDAQGQPTGWQPSGQRYEVATADYALMPALTTALAIHDQWGTQQQRYERLCRLSVDLWQGLQAIPGVQCLTATLPQSGLVSFQLTGADSDRHRHLVQTFEAAGIFLRTLAHPSCVRACVNYLTLESEVALLLEEVRHYCHAI